MGGGYTPPNMEGRNRVQYKGWCGWSDPYGPHGGWATSAMVSGRFRPRAKRWGESWQRMPNISTHRPKSLARACDAGRAEIQQIVGRPVHAAGPQKYSAPAGRKCIETTRYIGRAGLLFKPRGSPHPPNLTRDPLGGGGHSKNRAI